MLDRYNNLNTAESKEWDGCCTAFSWRRFLHFAGPSLLMSAAFVDPGNLEGDLQVGKESGYRLMWLMMTSTILGFIIQMLAAKLGVVTGRHLAEVCRAEYPPLPRYLLWLMMEIAIICSDMQEVIGSAIAINLLSHNYIKPDVGVIITAVTSFLLLYLDTLGPRVLEGFFGVLISTIAVAFIVLFCEAGVNGWEIVKGFVIPRIHGDAMSEAVGLVGSLIMPHNIYLHSAVVLSRSIDRTLDSKKAEALFYFGMEVAITLMVTVFINMCLIAVFATTYYEKPYRDVGLKQAGIDLGNIYGPLMKYVWAIGLIGSGQASVMAGGYAGQFVMMGFLDLKVSTWLRLLLSRSIAIVPTFIVAYKYTGDSLDSLNEKLNILQAVQIPFALVPVLVMTSRRRIMGPFANSFMTKSVCWLVSAAIFGINFKSFYDTLLEIFRHRSIAVRIICVIGIIFYIGFIIYLLVEPFASRRRPDISSERLLSHEDQNNNDGAINPELDDAEGFCNPYML